MSSDIPTEALEAAAKADYEAEWRDDCEPPWERLEQVHQDSYRRHAAAIVDAIWLFGVAAGRAQAAADIRKAERKVQATLDAVPTDAANITYRMVLAVRGDAMARAAAVAEEGDTPDA